MLFLDVAHKLNSRNGENFHRLSEGEETLGAFAAAAAFDSHQARGGAMIA